MHRRERAVDRCGGRRTDVDEEWEEEGGLYLQLETQEEEEGFICD